VSERAAAPPGPHRIELRAGRRYLWCACGRSAKQPLCDGAHAGGAVLPLFFTAPSTESALFCGCKRTATPPFCDGSHAR
jgi:CDGSH-type Zn-finger protein